MLFDAVSSEGFGLSGPIERHFLLELHAEAHEKRVSSSKWVQHVLWSHRNRYSVLSLAVLQS